MNNNFTFTPASFYAFRTPALPFQFLETWRNDASEALDSRRQYLRDRLREAATQPIIREALFLASPDLEAMVDLWLQDRLTPTKSDRVVRSLIRYLSRMGSRSTPFGLFAGCSVGQWGHSSKLVHSSWQQSLRHTRLDMDYLCNLIEVLEKDPSLRQALKYRVNSSMYLAAGRWHYVEGKVRPDRGQDYHLVALDGTPWLEQTLQGAQAGTTVETLAASLVGPDITLAEATHFIHELIDHQVLVSELRPALTGPEPVGTLVAQLAGGHGAGFSNQLEAVRTALVALDEQGLGVAPAQYRSIAEDMVALPAPLRLNRLFQVDLVKPAPEARLSWKVQDEIRAAAALHWQLTPAPGVDPLHEFKKAFLIRYEERWVPLMEALDEEHGIGFSHAAASPEAAPLLEGLALTGRNPSQGQFFTERDDFILHRLQELGSSPTWELNDADLRALENPEPNQPPDAFACMAVLAATSSEALDQGNFSLLLEGYLGPSGARLLGRFCHADPDLESLVRDHLRGEEALQPDAIFAEIVHLPEGRMGNVLCRPVLGRHEIPFLGVSGAPESMQIPLQDLEVAVQGDRVLLRSRRLDRKVLPRLTSAHNYSSGLSIYRFLGAVQDQGSSGSGWSWGPFAKLPYLPRVQRGRHVLQRARWWVQQNEIEAILKAPPDQAFLAFELFSPSSARPYPIGRTGAW